MPSDRSTLLLSGNVRVEGSAARREGTATILTDELTYDTRTNVVQTAEPVTVRFGQHQLRGTRHARRFERRHPAARIKCQWPVQTLSRDPARAHCAWHAPRLRGVALRGRAAGALLLGAAHDQRRPACRRQLRAADQPRGGLVGLRLQEQHAAVQARQDHAGRARSDRAAGQRDRARVRQLRMAADRRRQDRRAGRQAAVERSARHVREQRNRKCHRSRARPRRSSSN